MKFETLFSFAQSKHAIASMSILLPYNAKSIATVRADATADAARQFLLTSDCYFAPQNASFQFYFDF